MSAPTPSEALAAALADAEREYREAQYAMQQNIPEAGERYRKALEKYRAVESAAILHLSGHPVVES